VNIVVCIKRVPATGGSVTLTEDGKGIDTEYLGFTVGAHEECAVEAAVRLTEDHGGDVTVLTLGSADAVEQVRDQLARGAARGVVLEIDEGDWDPIATSAAIAAAVREQEQETGPVDLILFGNEAADSGDYQVPVRVAHALGRACLTAVKGIDCDGQTITARRDIVGAAEEYVVPLPAVLSVKEGINVPRYPSLPGKLKAKKAPVATSRPERSPGGPTLTRLELPASSGGTSVRLGEGVEAVPAIVDLLRNLGVIA
jgi:electron transfer flavoprotein beta subunit